MRCAVHVHVAAQVVGLEFEVRLQRALSALSIPFWTEEHLRAQGYHKTPDIKLKAGGGGWTHGWMDVRTAARMAGVDGGGGWWGGARPCDGIWNSVA